eukprot:gnl/MRDRNA2_/MRDRNA2_142092_c0_seq1.p1 gnl/MRDRNA2_/MRDRNA2_142092_c0~~gnl/MRDRNA2_/MRDRNA2_142092_c0_seq1.p1  ORF type:complete len:344 (-),score=52.84 gnl/MRDRNA2_/MRDRNA2_142092_c0_seq1:286-1317(-)
MAAPYGRFNMAAFKAARRRRMFAFGTVGTCGVVLTFEFKFTECIDVVGNPAQVTSPHKLFWMRMFFGRTRSRFVTFLTEANIPVTLRNPLFKSFAWMYGADLSECRYPLDSYRTFSDFFSRRIREGVRPVSKEAALVCPSDGTVAALGVVEGIGARVEQVKGASYYLPFFLGVDPVEKAQPNRVVRYATIYLAPGNYHRFHSPSDFTIAVGRHFAGEVLPVFKGLLQRFNDVFTVNERVVLSGNWEFGQMHYVAVAAYNVGGIFLDFDDRLRTNQLRDIVAYCGGDRNSKTWPKEINLAKADVVGGFRMGSTVVLVFESPENFEWKVAVGDKVQVGTPLAATS